MNKIHFFLPDGLGDLIIALPIAGLLHEQGYEIHWPVGPRHYSTMVKCAPWVRWYKLPKEPISPFAHTWGEYFEESGLPGFLKPADAIVLNLYHFIPVPQETDIFMKFDQFRYFLAKMPLAQKWRLGEYLVRDDAAEAALKAKVVQNEKYVVLHAKGSNVSIDFSKAQQAIEAQGYQVVEIVPGLTDNAVDWLGVIEGAQSLYLIDSCFANLVDQLNMPHPKVFFRRSSWKFTPVLLGNWEYEAAPADLLEQLEADFKRKKLPEHQYEDNLFDIKVELRNRDKQIRDMKRAIEKVSSK